MLLAGKKLEHHVPHDKAECVRCNTQFNKAWVVMGRIYVGDIFFTKEVAETTYDPLTQKFEEVLIEKRCGPVAQWKHGAICPDCASDYRCITRTRKDGSIEKIPRVKLDPLPTSRMTKNPGEVRERRTPSRLADLDDGFGERLKLTKEEVDARCYAAFMGRGRKR